MAYGYWKLGRTDQEAVFHLNFRRNPFEGGYSVACGLHYVVDFLENLQHSHEGILTAIRETKALSEDTVTALKDAIEEFRKSFETSDGQLLSGEDEQAEPLDSEGQETITRRVPEPAKDES